MVNILSGRNNSFTSLFLLNFLFSSFFGWNILIDKLYWRRMWEVVIDRKASMYIKICISPVWAFSIFNLAVDDVIAAVDLVDLFITSVLSSNHIFIIVTGKVDVTAAVVFAFELLTFLFLLFLFFVIFPYLVENGFFSLMLLLFSHLVFCFRWLRLILATHVLLSHLLFEFSTLFCWRLSHRFCSINVL